MASGLHDPKLLYAIPGVSAYHLANGTEEPLTPAGPQTLSLLMVPTASPFADAAVDGPQNAGNGGGGDGNGNGLGGDAPAEEDFYLHLHLPPELDLPLPATTQIYHQPPTSYLIPRWDLGRNSGVFTRLEFPPVGSRKGLQEDVDTFETILAQCTAFLERAPPPKLPKKSGAPVTSAAVAARALAGGNRSASSRQSTRHGKHGNSSSSSSSVRGGSHRPGGSRSSKSATTEDLPAYNPADFKPGEAYVPGSHSSQAGGQLVLIDEEDGSVIGELGEGFKVFEDKSLTPGSKEPVEITLPTEAVPRISVAPASREYVEKPLHPAYQKSTIVSNAVAASRLIVTTSEMVSKALQNQADSFASKAVPANKPITFQPSTHEHIRRINTISASAAGLSAKAVGQVGKVAQNLGAKLAGHKPQDSVSSVDSATATSTTTTTTAEGTGTTVSVRGKKAPTGLGPNGEPVADFKPGLLNKSLIAFSTVADGIEQAGRHLLDTSSQAATTVVASKWGDEAGQVTKHLTGGIKNVGLVYIDVTGVSRRAILKSVAKGMVVGSVPGGGELIVGSNEGDEVPDKVAVAAPAGGGRAMTTTTTPSNGGGGKVRADGRSPTPSTAAATTKKASASASASSSSSLSSSTPALPPRAIPPPPPTPPPRSSTPGAARGASSSRESERRERKAGGSSSNSSNSNSESHSASHSRARSTHEFADNNPYRGR